jgi:hypothetical protein
VCYTRAVLSFVGYTYRTAAFVACVRAWCVRECAEWGVCVYVWECDVCVCACMCVYVCAHTSRTRLYGCTVECLTHGASTVRTVSAIAVCETAARKCLSTPEYVFAAVSLYLCIYVCIIPVSMRGFVYMCV